MRSETTPRVHFEGLVALMCQERCQSHNAQALNLSLGGIFVRTDSPLTTGAQLRALFELPGCGFFEAMATVVRTTTLSDSPQCTGVALRFDKVANECVSRLMSFVAERLKPADGQRVSVALSELGSVIATTVHSSSDKMLTVDAELPFLRVGSSVQVQARETAACHGGSVRWVSVHTDADTGIPRLNIGIELHEQARNQPVYHEQVDPIHTPEFAAHVEAHEHPRRPADHPMATPDCPGSTVLGLG